MSLARSLPAKGRAIAERRPRTLLAALLLLGLLVRLPYLWVDTGTSNDVETFVRWARLTQAHGVTRIYHGTGVDYGPLAVYLLGAAARVEAHLPGALRGGDGALIALIKLPAIVADVVAAALLAWALGRRAGKDRVLGGVALIACAVYLFNPAVWYVTAYWGQTDSVYILFVLATVVALDRGAVVPAWLAYTAGLAMKLLGVGLAPLLVVWTLARHGVRSLAAGVVSAAVAASVLLLPWLVTGRIGEALHAAYLDLPTETPRVDVSAYNLWYLLFGGRVHEADSHSHLPLLGIRYQTMGILVFALFVLVVLALVLRRDGDVFLPAAILSLGQFVLLTQAHERYLLPVLSLTLLAGAWTAYAVLSSTCLFNLLTVASFAPSIVPNVIAVDAGSPKLVILKAIALAAAVVNLLVLWWLTAKMRGERRWRAARS
jgi:Gpi18-like mannosyltransferase